MRPAAEDTCTGVLNADGRHGGDWHRRRLRDAVNQIFTDTLMSGLGLLIVPAVVLPLFLDLPEPVRWFLSVIDSAIIGVFIFEYIAKLSLAEDRIAYAVDPWHILDLLIIVLPLLEYGLPFPTFVRSTPVLRILRLARIAAVGGRSVDRQTGIEEIGPQLPHRDHMLEVRAASGPPLHIVKGLTIEAAAAYRAKHPHGWIDMTGVGPEHYAAITRAFDLPDALLQSALGTEPYPSAERIDGDWLIVLRDQNFSPGGALRHSQIERGRLIQLSGSGIMTFSSNRDDHFGQIATLIDSVGDRTDVPLEQAVLSAIIRSQLDEYEHNIRTLDRSLLLLEERRSRTSPRRFLLCMYRERRLANRLVTDLFHLREVTAAVTSDEGLASGRSRKRIDLFGAIPHRIEFLHETASNIREGFSSLIELHINDQSYEMNSVMKVIALITAITLVPTLVGQMLGMNLLDSPWPYYLWQVLILTLATMLAIAYLFRQLGWMR